MVLAQLGIADVLEPLLSAYLAYLPWLLFVIGLLFVILGTTIGRRNRRAATIGLWLSAASALWIMLRLLYRSA